MNIDPIDWISDRLFHRPRPRAPLNVYGVASAAAELPGCAFAKRRGPPPFGIHA